jgi:hypothetical protein
MTPVHLRAGHGGCRPHRSRLRRNPLLPAALVSVVAASIAVAFLCYVLWPRWPEPRLGPDAPTLPITIAGTTFNLPPTAIRVALQRRPGAHERIDLAFLWPSLQPPGPGQQQPAQAPGTSPLPTPVMERIFLTIVAADDALAPDARVRTIYPRYLGSEALPGPRGLAVLPFREGTPYEGEDLIFDAAAPGFLVRCTRNGPAPLPGVCLQERRIGSADVVLRFLRAWLEDWRAVAANIDRLIAIISRS